MGLQRSDRTIRYETSVRCGRHHIRRPLVAGFRAVSMNVNVRHLHFVNLGEFGETLVGVLYDIVVLRNAFRPFFATVLGV